MTAWAEFSSALNASLTPSDVARAAAVYFGQVLGVERVIIVTEGASGQLCAVRTARGHPASLKSFAVTGAERLIGAVYRDGTSISSPARDWECLTELAGDSEAKWVLAAPLLAGRRVGALIATSNAGGFTSNELPAALRDADEQIAIAIERIITFERSRLEAITDPLTELYNRRYFMEALRNEIRKARRLTYGLGLFMIDIDDFKRVNDTYGHPAGDHVLASVARAIEKSVRASDVAARYGGEEFVVILVGCAESSLFDLG